MNVEYTWIYKVNNAKINGIVSADNEMEAKERVYDKYTNYGFKVNDVVLIKAEEYDGYDVDHNVLEL